MTWLTFHNIFLTFLILFCSAITLTLNVFAGNSKVDPCANIFCWNLLSRGSPSRLQIQKLLTDKSKLFVCKISRLGVAYSYITIIITTITYWKDIYFLIADSVGDWSGNCSGFICSAECYCWLGGLVLRATISAILSFIHLWKDPTQRTAKVLWKVRVCFSILDCSQPLFLLRTSEKVILKVNLARLSPTPTSL